MQPANVLPPLSWGQGSLPPPPVLKPEELYTTRRDQGSVLWQPSADKPAPLLDMTKVVKILQNPTLAFRLSTILTMEGRKTHPVPTRQQEWLFYALHKYRLVYIGSKYRQAKMSTAGVVGWLLRDCMYFEGRSGLIIANKRQTAYELFDRVRMAYIETPDPLKVPLDPMRTGMTKSLHFIHGGRIDVVASEDHSPGAGLSPDQVWFTEIGEIPLADLDNVINSFWPAFSRRPFGRMAYDTTPGFVGSAHYNTYMDAINDITRPDTGDGSLKSQWYPLFFEWWLDDTCKAPVPANFMPTREEEELMVRCPGMSLEAIVYRRQEMINNRSWTSEKWNTKYPPSPSEGWIGSDRAIIEQQTIDAWIGKTQPDYRFSYVSSARCYVVNEPVEGMPYAFFVDSAGIEGLNDPWAVTGFNKHCEEVAFFDGNDNVHQARDRLIAILRYYYAVSKKPPIVCVEANESSLLSLLIDYAAKDPFFQLMRIKGKYGWRASEPSVKAAQGSLIKALSEDLFTLRSQGALNQLRQFDGKWKRQKTNSGHHHYDRLRTIIMAAHLLPLLNWHNLKTTDITTTNSTPVLTPTELRDQGVKRASAERYEQVQRLFTPQVKNRRFR